MSWMSTTTGRIATDLLQKKLNFFKKALDKYFSVCYNEPNFIKGDDEEGRMPRTCRESELV